MNATSYLGKMASTAAFFDLDKTIIARSSTLAFTKPLYKAGYLTGVDLARATIAHSYYQAFGADHEQMEKVKEELANLTKGWDRGEVMSLVEQSVEDVLAPLVYAEALDVIDGHRELGRQVVVISSSPEEIVRPVCRHLGITDVIATRAEIDVEGKYTGKIELYVYGQVKAETMMELARQRGIDLEASYAYSDSVTDLPMLEAVGHPVAVNPDRELLAAASERDWEIRWFESEVTLRDRVGAKAIPSAAVVGGLTAAAIAYRAVRKRRS